MLSPDADAAAASGTPAGKRTSAVKPPRSSKNPRGAGRKPKRPDLGPMTDKTVRMPPAFWEYIAGRGGSEYLRALVEADMMRQQGRGQG